MGQLIDNLIAVRILYLLVTPFNKTDAFKLGIVDKDGVLLKPVEDFRTQDEKDSYSYLHRLVFNLKRLIGKLPGGKSMIASLVAAYFLIKEGIEHNDLSSLEERFNVLNNQLSEGTLCLPEEQLLIEKFLIMIEDGEAAPANSVASGQMATTELPIGIVKKRNNWKNLPKTFGITTFPVSGKAYNGFKNAKTKGAHWDKHLIPSNEDAEAYDNIRKYSKTYPNNPIMIKHRDIDIHQFIKV